MTCVVEYEIKPPTYKKAIEKYKGTRTNDTLLDNTLLDNRLI